MKVYDICIKKYQKSLALILARSFTVKELEQIKIPNSDYNISCEFNFNDNRRFKIDDNIVGTNYIDIYVDNDPIIRLEKYDNTVTELRCTLGRSINYRNYGRINNHNIVDKDMYDTLSFKISNMTSGEMIDKMIYILSNNSPDTLHDKFYVDGELSIQICELGCMIKFIVKNNREENFIYFRNSRIGISKIIMILVKAKYIFDLNGE